MQSIKVVERGLPDSGSELLLPFNAFNGLIGNELFRAIRFRDNGATARRFALKGNIPYHQHGTRVGDRDIEAVTQGNLAVCRWQGQGLTRA